jgi:hypothetical protein
LQTGKLKNASSDPDNFLGKYERSVGKTCASEENSGRVHRSWFMAVRMHGAAALQTFYISFTLFYY